MKGRAPNSGSPVTGEGTHSVPVMKPQTPYVLKASSERPKVLTSR